MVVLYNLSFSRLLRNILCIFAKYHLLTYNLIKFVSLIDYQLLNYVLTIKIFTSDHGEKSLCSFFVHLNSLPSIKVQNSYELKAVYELLGLLYYSNSVFLGKKRLIKYQNFMRDSSVKYFTDC